MTDRDDGFTAEQAAAANGVLRGALGLPPQRFGTAQFVGMISDEIEQLRAAGKTDADITDLLSRSVGVKISPEAIARFYAGPQERGRPG
ncbi:MAG: hypothetical protein NVSMB19_00270 [Vulcanimicrobiaceae bacterium]